MTETGDHRSIFKPAVIVSILCVILLDQLSKYWIVETIFDQSFFDKALFDFQFVFIAKAAEVTSFFNIVLYGNKGIAFGLLSNNSPYASWFFAFMSLSICAGIIYWLWQTKSRYHRWAMILIVGGALGNLIDRLRLSAVVDFIELHYAGYFFPAFNIADSCIFIGAMLLIFFDHKKISDEKSS